MLLHPLIITGCLYWWASLSLSIQQYQILHLQDQKVNFPGCNNLSLHLQTVVFGAYLIAHGFFSVYAMCVDTLFLCFCKCEQLYLFHEIIRNEEYT